MKILIITCIAVLLVLAGFVRASSAEQPKRRLEIGVSLAQETPPDKDQSYISIHSLSTYKIKTGHNINVPLTIYRGVTLKRTVYLWIHDSENKRISSKPKFSLLTRFMSYDLSAALNFSKCHANKTYTIIAQGLGLNETKQVSLDFINCDQESATATETDGKLSFSVISHKETIESGVPFKTRILISNPTEQHLEVDAWSYVYRSSKCYSGDREQNRKTLNVPEFSNITFDMENTANAPEGDYNLKIKFIRSDRKTPKEITLPIKVQENAGDEDNKGDEEAQSSGSDHVSEGKKKNLLIAINEDSDTDNTNKSSPKKRSLFSFSDENNSANEPIYESSSAKARRLTVYFLILVLALVLIALILKRM
jgi:hypothetical protein